MHWFYFNFTKLLTAAVMAIDLDPGVMGSLTYTVTNQLFSVATSSDGMVSIVVNG